MEGAETLVMDPLINAGPTVGELVAEYERVLLAEVQSNPDGDVRQARVAAVVAVARVVTQRERDRIASSLVGRSYALAGMPAAQEDHLAAGLRGVIAFRGVRRAVARAVYRVLAEMVRRGQV
ncbi:hypothetical protein AB0C10_15950 [Microbispora amethystogenes]|uniref:hypothetical protein n=1 Tax=Microbispora amethystogenes TaxID=1427754 RepID=UPI0034014E4E